MNDVFFDFQRTVSADYEWRDWLNEAGRPVVVPVSGLESASAVEQTWNRSQQEGKKYGPVLHPLLHDSSEPRPPYRPMERQHAALFREFADLDYKSPDAVLTFAKSYGSLDLPTQSQLIRLRGADGLLHDHHAHGEPFLGWAVEICFMRDGLRLAGEMQSSERPQRLKWLFNRNLQHVQGRLELGSAGEPKLLLEPRSLIAAMWLQFTMALVGEKRFVACKFCRRMFEISTDQSGFRSHREFCSDSCKTKDYRKRKRTALRLGFEGKRPAEISEMTKTELATIRSWLGAAKRSRNDVKLGRK